MDDGLCGHQIGVHEGLCRHVYSVIPTLKTIGHSVFEPIDPWEKAVRSPSGETWPAPRAGFLDTRQARVRAIT